MNERKNSGCLGKIGVILICVSVIFAYGGFLKTETGHLTAGVKAAMDIIYFPQQEYYVDEDAGEIVITVCRIRNAIWSIDANYATSDGTAVAGQDYTSSFGVISMGVWLTTEIAIPILDDSIVEGDESFTITLDGEYTLHDPQNGYYKSCTVIIVDDEDAASNNNELSTLETNQGLTEPAFTSQVHEYNIFVGSAISSINIKATASDSTAGISIDGTVCGSGTWSQPIALASGQNTVIIRVEAQNGDLRFYYLDVFRDIPPGVSFVSGGFYPQSGNLLQAGEFISFEAIHTVGVEDLSYNGYGWRLEVLLEEYVSCSTIQDPSVAGQEYLEVRIPVSECLNHMKITGISYPDGSYDDTDVPLDTTGFVIEDNHLIGQIYENTSGEAGEYVIEIQMGLSIPSWLPAGTVINAQSDGGRFDSQPGNAENNSMTVTGGDGIQLFSGEYSFEMDYNVERLL